MKHKDSICVWLKDAEYLKKNYPQHLKLYVEDNESEV
jgi:hypothetical protein